MSKISLIIALKLFLFSDVIAGTLKGVVTDENDLPLPGVTVLVKETQQGVVTDVNGAFEIPNIPTGNYTLTLSFIGFETISKKIIIENQSEIEVNFKLKENVSELEEVIISTKSESKILSENPLQVSSIDITSLQTETSDAVAVLDRVSGVRIRQNGGLGSSTIIQLNGLTGRAVRTYYDGVPLELFGGGIQINNIPVNNIERIDIYKGVMPIDVGTDALAGGINIISRQMYYDYLDASYQFGSFNTHVATLNTTKKINDHLFVSLSGFYNYSNNDYKIRALQWVNFDEVEVEVDRFHSAHQSSMILGSIGWINTTWADKLTYTISYNQRYDEVQHGVRISNVPVGEAFLERDVIVQNIRYKKSFLNDKINVDYFSSLAISHDFVDDSTTNVYDWFGNIISYNAQGREVLSDPSRRKGQNNAHAHRLNLAYKLNDNHKLKTSGFYSAQKISGNDPMASKIPTDDPNAIDPNTIPSNLYSFIAGVSYESKLLDDKLENILFGKYYYYNQSTSDFNQVGGATVFKYEENGNESGFGFGTKYIIKADFYLKASYEQAIRIPTKDEVFGNFTTIAPNFNLKPEQSENLNIGGYYKHHFSTHKFISLDLNWFLRDQTDLIRLRAGRNENDPSVYINEEEADASGIELTLSSNPIEDLEISATLTSQRIVKDGERNANDTNGIGDAIPNIPTFFYNLSSRYSFLSPISKSDQISVFGYFGFVGEFDLLFQGDGAQNDALIIPAQQQLDLGLTYTLAETGFNFSFQANNVLNSEVFDNFRVPNPGRNFSIKLRYFINDN